MDRLKLETDLLVRNHAAQAGLSVARTDSTSAAPVVMDPTMRGLLERCVARRGLPVFHMDSGAGHDAQIFAQVLPAAMLFAPSRGGASHCQEEFTLEADLQLACDLLYAFVKEDF